MFFADDIVPSWGKMSLSFTCLPFHFLRGRQQLRGGEQKRFGFLSMVFSMFFFFACIRALLFRLWLMVSF